MLRQTLAVDKIKGNGQPTVTIPVHLLRRAIGNIRTRDPAKQERAAQELESKLPKK